MPSRKLASQPRFGDVAVDRGHYESFYAKLSSPDEPLGLWIRYTVHKRRGGLARGAVWCTLFDREGGPPVAVKQTFDELETGRAPEEYARFGPCRADPDTLVGEIVAAGRTARWEIRVDGAEAPFRHLARDWMYGARLPRTKLLSPHPGARFSGSAEVDGRGVEVRDWPGMVGHNWGAEHAERWIWAHGTEFEDEPGAWLDLALGRIKVGPWTTPWIANGALSVNGERHRIGGPERFRRTEVRESPSACEFTIPGDGLVVDGVLSAPREAFVGWVYADPDGSQHNVVNCSVARMSLVVRREGRPDLTLRTDHGAAYELGMRETDHGVPIQPFTDG